MASSIVTAAGAGRLWRLPRHELLLWALPPLLFLAVTRAPSHQIERGIGATIALGVAVLVARRPAAGLVFVVPWLALQLSVLAFLHEHGVPIGVVRPMGATKDVILIGLLLAAVGRIRAEHRRLDVLDGLALGYIALATLYLAVPGIAGATPEDLSVRFLAWRTDVAFVALFLAVRHLRLGAAARRHIAAVAVVTGAVVGAVALYEAAFSSAWNDFAVDVLGVQRYKLEVLDTAPPDLGDVRYHDVVGDREITRAGSVLFAPVTLALFLVVMYAVGIAGTLRQHARSSMHVAVALVAAGTMVTFTRAGIIALLLVPLVALRLTPGALETVRVRVTAVLLCGSLVFLPFILQSGLGARFAGQDDGSAEDHGNTFVEGVERLVDEPLGSGLGSAPGVGDRFEVEGRVTSHNSYLQVGNELGVLSLVVFGSLFVVLVRRCIAAARRLADPTVAVAAAGAGVSLGVAGLFQHVWTEIPVALLFWALAGLAVGALDALRPDDVR